MKRQKKAPRNDQPLINTISTSAVDNSVELDIDQVLQQINRGESDELNRRAIELVKEKERCLASADRLRKMKIRNANQQYDYEVDNINAQFERSYAELKDELVQQIMQIRETMLKEKKNLDHSPSSNCLESLNDIRKSIKINNINGQKVGRSMRSGVPTNDEMNPDPINSNDMNSHAIKLHKSSGKPDIKKKTNVNGHTAPKLNYSLTESAMRNDFVEIVRDLKQRVESVEQTTGLNVTREVIISPDASKVTIDQEVFSIGDNVVIFMTSTQENIVGVVFAISQVDMIVRTGTGTKFMILIGQIRNGRVSLSKDDHLIHHTMALNTAIEMNLRPSNLLIVDDHDPKHRMRNKIISGDANHRLEERKENSKQKKKNGNVLSS